MSEDYLTQDEALTEIVGSFFTEHGPQINIDSKSMIDRLWMSVRDDLGPEEQEIAAVGLVTGCVNGSLTLALERWGVSVTINILKEIVEQYEKYIEKAGKLN